MIEGSGYVHLTTDTDLGVPKTYGSYGSGSPILYHTVGTRMFLILIRSTSVLIVAFVISMVLWFLLMLTLLLSVVAGHKESWASSAPAREEEVWPGAARRPPPHTTPRERSRHQWWGRQRSVSSESERILYSLLIWIWISNYNFGSGFKSE